MIFNRKKYFLKLLLLLFILFNFKPIHSYYACNTNEHCPAGYWCSGGTAYNEDVDLSGECKKTTALTSICTVHDIAKNKFGKILTSIAILIIGANALISRGELSTKTVVTFIISTIMIYSSFEIVKFILDDNEVICDSL